MKQTSIKKQLINALAVTVITTSSLGGVFLASPAAMTNASAASTSAIKYSEKDAVKKFQKEFKDSKVTEIQLEEFAGSYRYEVSGRDNTKEHNLYINAKNGKVTDKHSERLDNNDDDTALDLSKLISRKQATKIAEKAAKSGKAHDWTLSYDDGNPVWEIEVGKGHKQHDVKVNADTKKVISNEVDD